MGGGNDVDFPTIRTETTGDRAAIRSVHRRAFGQDDEANIVDALRDGGFDRVSLVAEAGGAIIGHVLFSDLPIVTNAGTVPALALAPVGVLPEFQRRGVGSALIRQGLEVSRMEGHQIVVVLGHADYYPRFGFSANLAEPLASPFDGRDAWMALELVPGALAGVRGWVNYPPPFGLGVQTRPAYRPDRDEWLRMRNALWLDDSAAHHAAEVAAFFDTGTFGGPQQWPPWTAFVAERHNGGLCGFIEASIRPFVDGCTSGPVGYVEGWYVDPDIRRQGIGRRLVEAAERWAAMHGCREMASDARLDNAVSHAAHAALAFEEIGRLVHFRKSLPDRESAAAPHPPRLELLHVAGSFAVCKLDADAALPAWATVAEPFSVTRTADELSVTCRQEFVPAGVVCERDWRCLRVAGTMPFTQVGVLAALTAPVARAGVGIFAISTFDTDYLFVKAGDTSAAVAALRTAGHTVQAGEAMS